MGRCNKYQILYSAERGEKYFNKESQSWLVKWLALQKRRNWDLLGSFICHRGFSASSFNLKLGQIKPCYSIRFHSSQVEQCGFLGVLIRVCLCSLGTKENVSVAKTLQEMWAPVESDVEKHAVSLLRWIIHFKESFLSSIMSLGGTICCLLSVLREGSAESDLWPGGWVWHVSGLSGWVVSSLSICCLTYSSSLWQSGCHRSVFVCLNLCPVLSIHFW